MVKYTGFDSPMKGSVKNPCKKGDISKVRKHRKDNMAKNGIGQGKNPLV